ncbi:uncharacterized protein ACNS7B_020773 isoform 1-T5 [Menidia menidia]
MTNTDCGLSPPRFKQDYPHHSEYEGTAGADRDPPSRKMTKREDGTVNAGSCRITYDLCEVHLANAQELETHLDNKNHWDTQEYIHQNKSYDDLTIAFIQLCRETTT